MSQKARSRGKTSSKKVLAEGKYIKLVEENGWEYAERTRVSGIVAIVAVTRKGNVLLTEQYRPPVRKRVTRTNLTAKRSKPPPAASCGKKPVMRRQG
jgi:ADP-ribose pyrophosphatase